MGSFFGNDQVVPKDQESPYYFSTSDYLFQQVATTPSFGSSDMYDVGESKSTADEISSDMPGFSHGASDQLLYPKTTLNESSMVESGSAILEALPTKKTGLLGDLVEQLDGLGAIDSVDEIYLSSQLQKSPPNMNTHLEPETLQNGHLADMVMASQSIPYTQSGGNNEKGNTVVTSVTTPTFGSTSYNCSSTTIVPDDAFKIPDELSMSNLDEERSLEEMVLKDLQLVIRKMTKKTRICFRDALYRLANISKHNSLCFEESGENSMGVPSLSSIHNTTLRYGGMSIMKSENNAIDRSIASLMFNEQRCEQQDLLSTTSSATSAYEPYNYRTWT